MRFATLFFQLIGGQLIARITTGIAVREIRKDEKNTQQVVQLGRFGSGQWCVRVGFLRGDPPVVKNGKIYEGRLQPLANTRKKEGDSDVFYCIGTPAKDDDDASILVRVNTEGKPGSGAKGTWWKDSAELPFGWGRRDGAEEGAEVFLDGLVMMAPGETLEVQAGGAENGDIVLLFHDPKRGLTITPAKAPKPLPASEPVDRMDMPEPIVPECDHEELVATAPKGRKAAKRADRLGE